MRRAQFTMSQKEGAMTSKPDAKWVQPKRSCLASLGSLAGGGVGVVVVSVNEFNTQELYSAPDTRGDVLVAEATTDSTHALNSGRHKSAERTKRTRRPKGARSWEVKPTARELHLATFPTELICGLFNRGHQLPRGVTPI